MGDFLVHSTRLDSQVSVSLSFPDEGTKIINKVDANDDPAKTCFSFLSLQFEMEISVCK